jgi:translation initiation factor IF-3
LKRLNINHHIQARELRLLSETGDQLGIHSRADALRMAESEGKDLVEINPTSNPPIAKIIDYGKFLYVNDKKEKEAKKAQVTIKIKEIKLKPNIGDHDFETKLKHAREFLHDGNKIKLSIMFRGREVVHKDLGKKRVEEFYEKLKDIAIKESETPYQKENRSINMILSPLASAKRPKPKLGESEE